MTPDQSAKAFWQKVIDQCDEEKSREDHKKKIADMDYHTSEAEHQWGRWHCANDISEWAESNLNAAQAQPSAPADVVEKMAEALKALVRNGQKQGWNDNYEADMNEARSVISAYEASLQPTEKV